MKPIENWRQSWRMLSVQIASVALAWGLLPADQQAHILDLIGVSPERVPAVLGMLFLVGRLIDQPATREQAQK